MARPGTLCIATVTVLVILVAAVQTGIVAYLEGVPLNPSFEGLPSKILCANMRLHTGTPLYKFYFATRDGDMLHKATPLIVSHHHGTYMLQDAGGRSISRLLVSNLYTSK